MTAWLASPYRAIGIYIGGLNRGCGQANLTAAWIAALPEDTAVAVIEVPLLFEGGREKVFDTTVSIVAGEDVRRERAASRGHALVDAREARQLTQEEKAERADHVIVNDGTVADLEAALSALLAKLQG